MTLAKFISIPAIAVLLATPVLAQDEQSSQSNAGGGTLSDTLWVTDPEDFTDVALTDLSAEALQGAPAYSADQEAIGTVSDVSTEGGAIQNVTIEVGGVLGFGQTPLLFEADMLHATQNDRTGEVHVITDMDRNSIVAMATREESGE